MRTYFLEVSFDSECGKWIGMCRELGLFVEEITQSKMIETALELAPEMIELRLGNDDARLPARLMIESHIAPTHHLVPV